MWILAFVVGCGRALARTTVMAESPKSPVAIGKRPIQGDVEPRARPADPT
jgi:hypothetical protein